MQHMNADRKDALILIAKRFAGIEAQQAGMTAVDRLGFHLRLTTRDGNSDRVLAGSERYSANQRGIRRNGEGTPGEDRDLYV